MSDWSEGRARFDDDLVEGGLGFQPGVLVVKPDDPAPAVAAHPEQGDREQGINDSHLLILAA